MTVTIPRQPYDLQFKEGGYIVTQEERWWFSDCYKNDSKAWARKSIIYYDPQMVSIRSLSYVTIFVKLKDIETVFERLAR